VKFFIFIFVIKIWIMKNVFVFYFVYGEFIYIEIFFSFY